MKKPPVKLVERISTKAKEWYKKVRPPLASRDYRIEIAKKVSDELVKECGAMVEAVFVVGSVAEGSQTRKSDLDLLVVLDTDYPTGVYYDFNSKIRREAQNRFGFKVDIRHIPKETLEPLKRGTHFIDGAIGGMLAHGVKPIYSKEGFLENYEKVFSLVD